jgi:hypothetical protein
MRPRLIRRARRSLLCLLLLGAVTAAGATPALSANLTGGNSFSELTSGAAESQTPTTSTTAATRSSTETGNSQSLILIAAAAAILLLSAIAFVIVRDARRMAPATDVDVLDARSGHEAAVRLRKRRAKAKAARKQRKRTR